MFKETTAEDIKLIIVTIAIIFAGLAAFIIFFIFLFNRRKNKLMNDKILMKTQFQQELLRTQLEIQEQTLKTISQEIHDNIGQILSLAKLNLNTMDISKQDQLQEKIFDSKKLVSKAIQDLRDLSKSMNTDNIEALGLVRAIEYELEMIRKTGFTTELNVEGTIIRLEPQKELILFRIIQEILNNIMKHAEATTIETKVVYATHEITIIVKDNGKGFDPAPLNDSNSNSGLGIRNMHNRAKLIGADFSMISSTGKGTDALLVVPLNNLNL
jgi:signal transduction histidine kinase